MKKRLLFGLFYLVLGGILLVTSLSKSVESYAYPENTVKTTIRIYYEDEANTDIVDETAKSSFQVINETNEIVRAFETFIGSEYTEITGLKPGKYSIRQLIAPTEYNTQELEVIDVVNSDEVQNFYLSSTKSEDIKLAIALLDIKTNKMIAGAEFHLLDTAGNLIDTCTTSTGYCYLKGIQNQVYKLENVIAPPGYITLDTVNVDMTNETIKTKYLTFYTEGTKVIVNLYDEKTNEFITDCDFNVINAYQEIVYKLNDNNLIENIKPGDYVLDEINPPKGYKSLAEEVSFTVDETTDEQIINIYYERDDLKQNNSFYIFIVAIISIITGLTYFLSNRRIKNKK